MDLGFCEPFGEMTSRTHQGWTLGFASPLEKQVEDCILLDKDYFNGCIGICFCFNFQENLFTIVSGNLHYK